MDENVSENKSFMNVTFDEHSRSAVNSLILDYYQKFGRKRDLEQFFSLSTAQSDIRDPSSLFWRKMKVQSDSSDSGEGKTEPSSELCRISIKCSLHESSTSQDDNLKLKDDSVSPPIITKEPVSTLQTERSSPDPSDNGSVKSEDNNSQKSTEAHLDISMNKPVSPTSSITSQRKLEWDSLGDVGYGNESERKVSASSLSTLERLALHQQYSYNDTKQDTNFLPTSHSTPVEPNISYKGKNTYVKKTTKIYKKDVDFVELNVPCTSENAGAISVNLTKHISFNVNKDGDVTVGNSKEDVKFSPDKVSVETEMTPQLKMDKEIQTTLTQNKSKNEKSVSSIDMQTRKNMCEQKFPIQFSLKTLKKRKRKKKLKMFRKNVCNRSKTKINVQNLPPDKSQISEAESFEYMPGHIYNENQVKYNNVKDSNSVGNKSSLESSIVLTTDSSKASKNSFYKDLENSIKLLKEALQPKYDNSNLKEKLIKQVVQRLLKTRYSDDDSGTVFLSGLSFNNKKLGIPISNHTATSTSDGTNIDNSNAIKRPKKSILRVDKFNPNGMASTSQSTPNLHTLAQSDKPSKMIKTPTFSNTDSDFSSRERNSSDTVLKLSSQELYNKYLEALKREQIHKKLLKDKETLLKKKLVSSDTCIKTLPEICEKSHDRLYKLIKDLAQNNVVDGSGDASKFEGASNSIKHRYNNIKKQRSHSVFTLASGKSTCCSKSVKHKTCQKDEKGASEAGCSKINNNCCFNSQHTDNDKSEVTDTSLQESESCEEEKRSKINYHFYNKDTNATEQIVKINKITPRAPNKVILENTRDFQYVCLCSKEAMEAQDVPEKLLIYKCSRVGTSGICLPDTTSKTSSSVGIQCSNDCLCTKKIRNIKLPMTTLSDNAICLNKDLQSVQSSSTVLYPARKASTLSQTEANLGVLLQRKSSGEIEASIASNAKCRPKIIVNKEENALCKCDKYKPELKSLSTIIQSTQTEISIDPKISDPTLSDVNFIYDIDYVKQTDEQENCRSLSKNISNNTLCCDNIQKQQLKCCNEPQTTAIHEDQAIINNNCNVSSDIKSSDDLNHLVIHNKEKGTVNVQVPKSKENKFSIPIQGTNMTLVVSLGSNTTNITDIKTNIDMKPDGSSKNQIKITDKENIYDVGDSKGVQCTSTDIFTQIDNPYQVKTNVSKDNEGIKILNKEFCSLNTNATEYKSKCNTYPMKSQPMKKPSVRSNTDLCCLESAMTNINDNMKVNAEAQQELLVDPKRQRSSKDIDVCEKSKENLNKDLQYNSIKPDSCGPENNVSKDPILNIIQDLTKRYTKCDMEKGSRKKCFKEIITVLNYLLDTEDSSDLKEGCPSSSNSDGTSVKEKLPQKDSSESMIKKIYVDKGVQLSIEKHKKQKSYTESSDTATSSALPTTSTDSAACRVLNKIKRECEKYHQNRCKCKTQSGQKKCVQSSTTSVNCEKCNCMHYCSCRSKCKGHKAKSNVDKGKKKCVAYNLIIQTSDSMASDETIRDEGCRQLQNIIVKVPPKHKQVTNAPFKEVSTKIEKNLPHFSTPCFSKAYRSRSLPNDSEMSSEDLYKKMHTCTVRNYLEMNRPDFIEKTRKRQDCMKIINQTRTYERAANRKLLSQQLERQQTLNALSSDEIHHLAKELGAQLSRKKVAPKFISEREMKKHSEKIYKSLPEVVQKKEELKKENIKRTNLLMASIFKKNLQKKTLRGSINLSNYSTVVKI